MKTGIILSGATAVGKTDISIILAKELNSEIISADSTQIYKELNIGTAKITKEEMQGIKHHLLDIIEIEEEYSVGKFNEDVSNILNNNDKEYIIVGGTGLYTDVLNHGLAEMPEISLKLRKELEEKKLEELQNQLFYLDEEMYNKIDKNNKVRLVRAIEVCILSGKTMTEIQKKTKQSHDYTFLNIFLTRSREKLYERIDKRVDIMLENGLLDEGKKIYYKYGEKMKKIKAIGYRQMYNYFSDELSYEKMVEEIKKLSRNYAKRQITWFKNKGYLELNIDNKTTEEVAYEILEIYKNFKNRREL